LAERLPVLFLQAIIVQAKRIYGTLVLAVCNPRGEYGSLLVCERSETLLFQKSDRLMIRRIVEFLKIKSRLYLVYVHNKQNEIPEENIAAFRSLGEKYRLSIARDSQEFVQLDFKSSIMGKDAITHFKQCLKNGGYVFLVFDDAQLIFRCCVQKGPYESPILGHSYVRIPLNSYYVEYAETHQRYQRQKIYQWILFLISTSLNNSDIYIGTDLENISSQKGIEKTGFVIKEAYGIIRFLFFSRVLNKVNYFGDTLLVTNHK
jgi:hypothetical protein